MVQHTPQLAQTLVHSRDKRMCKGQMGIASSDVVTLNCHSTPLPFQAEDDTRVFTVSSASTSSRRRGRIDPSTPTRCRTSFKVCSFGESGVVSACHSSNLPLRSLPSTCARTTRRRPRDADNAAGCPGPTSTEAKGRKGAQSGREVDPYSADIRRDYQTYL